MTSDRVLLQAALADYAPPVQTRNPFKRKQKRPPRPSGAPVGTVQLVVRTAPVATHVVGGEAEAPPTPSYFLRFIDVRVYNEKNWPLYVLLSRSNRSLKAASKRANDALLRALETQGEIVALDAGPDGQWVGAQLPASFEQQIFLFDPLVFASVVICKPAAARPPTATPQVVAHGIFESYLPPEKTPDQVKAELDALAVKMNNTVMEMESNALQDEHLDLDALQRNARELFKLFDQDKSDSIDFNEYKQMLAYRGLKLLDSKAMRLFQLVDDQRKGYIDEREFVIALYITNALRVNAKKQTGALPNVLSPVDVFHQLDSDRDNLLNVFEYEKAMHLLGIEVESSAKARSQFPKGASVITLEQFKAAWLELIDVHEELRKRGITARSADVLHTSNEPEKGFIFPFAKSKHKATKEKERMKRVLMQWITQVEHEELEEALKAKEEVCNLDKARRDQAQEEKRALFAQQRRLETSTRTNEALRERQEKVQRRKERVIKECQAREEKKLLAQIAEEQAKRELHERQAVQEHMASKMEKITRQKAKHGDDVLDLSCRRLMELPSYVYRGKDAISTLSSLLIINLSGNRLCELPSAIFTHLFSLQVLDLSDNNIDALPIEIGEARDLRILDARNNALTTLPLEIRRLESLKVLTLSHNQLVHFGDIPRRDSLLRDSYCKGLTALEELDLSYNTGLLSIADAVGELQHLQVFRIRGCTSLKRLPDAFHKLRSLLIFDVSMSHQKRFGRHVFGADLRSLRTMNLSFNDIVALPESLGEVKTLQELNVAHNSLANFQEHLAMLTELVVLKGSNNKIDSLPESVGQLTNLEVLDLSRNVLRSPLPPTMGLLRSLHCLDLQHNRLTEIPMEFGALFNVRELNLAWNRLSCLPDEIGCMVSLKKLYLAHNCFVQLPDSIVLWHDLELLDISHNALSTPLTTSMAKLNRLVYLDVSVNKLTQLEPSIYALPSVQVLNMSGNKLSRLPVELISAPAAKSLKKLDLYNNKIVAIPVEWTGLLSSLDVVSIGRNPMSLLPEKWSDHWRDGRWQRGDVYATASMRGYTPTQAVEWVHDRSAVYPHLVTVWKERQPFTGSDDFIHHVRMAMECNDDDGSMWQHQFERIVRHYYYEFKYLGHEIALHSIDEAQQQMCAATEVSLRDEQAKRADAAIASNDAFREKLRQAYAFDQATHRTSMETRRRHHEAQLLVSIQDETRQWNEVISEKLPMVEQRHDMIVKERKKRFAEDMKMIARQRVQEKMANERVE